MSCVVTNETTSCEFLTLLPRFVGPFDFEPSDFEPFDFPLLLLLLLLPFQLLFSCDFADLEVIEPPFTVGDRLFMLLFFFAEGHCRFVNPVDGELFRRDRATTSCYILTFLPRFEPFEPFACAFEPFDFSLLLLLLLPFQTLFFCDFIDLEAVTGSADGDVLRLSVVLRVGRNVGLTSGRLFMLFLAEEHCKFVTSS